MIGYCVLSGLILFLAMSYKQLGTQKPMTVATSVGILMLMLGVTCFTVGTTFVDMSNPVPIIMFVAGVGMFLMNAILLKTMYNIRSFRSNIWLIVLGIIISVMLFADYVVTQQGFSIPLTIAVLLGVTSFLLLNNTSVGKEAVGIVPVVWGVMIVGIICMGNLEHVSSGSVWEWSVPNRDNRPI